MEAFSIFAKKLKSDEILEFSISVRDGQKVRDVAVGKNSYDLQNQQKKKS